MDTIKKITDTRLEITKVIEQKTEIEKATLEAQRQGHLDKIAEIDLLLSEFDIKI